MAKMVTNPITGSAMNISPKGLLSLFVGALLLLFTIGSAQKVARAVESKLNNQYIDGTPTAFESQEKVVVNQKVYRG